MEAMPRENRLISRIALLAPIILVIHVIEEAPTWRVALVATALGSLPMAAHGYLIVFRGSRLF